MMAYSPSAASAGSHVISVVVPHTFWAVGVQQLGIAVLTEHVRWAAVAMLEQSTTPRQAKRSSESVAFIRGTGLELLLEAFALDLHADRLRETLTLWVTQRKTPWYP